VSKRDIEEDLRIIKKISSCVRTYGVSAGLEQVPQVARELGMKVRLGAWLGRDEKQNQRELTEAILLTKSHTDVVELLIVGNEVLLRKELFPNDLMKLLRQAKAQSAVPITYADVWEFWRSNPELSRYVDNIAIHILPYWEDEPVAALQAVEHVFSTFTAMQKVFPGKSLWIAETGWPPWKRALEGAMGGAWGLFDANGTVKQLGKSGFVNDSKWWRGWLGAIVGATVGLTLALGLRLRRPDYAKLLLCASIIGTLAPAQSDFILLWARSAQETTLAIGHAFLVISGSISLLLLCINRRSSSMRNAMTFTYVAMLFASAASAIVLLADARYRGFFLALYALPAIVSIAVLPRLTAEIQLREARFLSLALAIAAIAMLYQEQLDNTQAAVLCCYWLCIALPAWFSTFWPRSATSPVAKSAIAQSSGV
jgi:hypothetical protein